MLLSHLKQALYQNTPYPCALPIHTSPGGQSKIILKTASFLEPHTKRSCSSDPTEQTLHVLFDGLGKNRQKSGILYVFQPFAQEVSDWLLVFFGTLA